MVKMIFKICGSMFLISVFIMPKIPQTQTLSAPIFETLDLNMLGVMMTSLEAASQPVIGNIQNPTLKRGARTWRFRSLRDQFYLSSFAVLFTI
ncbi:hypothetical protein ACFL27_07590, partial [candidate division CSSED10-310 bacterium]